MLRFHKFHQDLFGPVPARDAYNKPGPGKGWPEECPPIRAANSFGFDILANFDITFTFARGKWSALPDNTVESDFNYSGDETGDDTGDDAGDAGADDAGDMSGEGSPLFQQYAWFWEKGQKLPHPISDNVYEVIKHQVKISSFLYLQTDPNELLIVGELPNQRKSWRAVSALIDTDWYPASYPWHAVIELDPKAKSITIEKGEPIARLLPVRRDTYFARAMDGNEFMSFFDRGQSWIEKYGKSHEAADASTRDITRTYVKQQIRSKFVVMD